jgi:hypothetical protein
VALASSLYVFVDRSVGVEFSVIFSLPSGRIDRLICRAVIAAPFGYVCAWFRGATVGELASYDLDSFWSASPPFGLNLCDFTRTRNRDFVLPPICPIRTLAEAALSAAAPQIVITGEEGFNCDKVPINDVRGKIIALSAVGIAFSIAMLIGLFFIHRSFLIQEEKKNQ